MTDEVLTDDEKEALTDGVLSGEVEVHDGDGFRAGNVVNYEVSPRNIIVRFSYPRLATVCNKLAAHLCGSTTLLLNSKTEIQSQGLTSTTWGEFSEQHAGLSLLVRFTSSPLDGPAVVQVPAASVREIVEAFYGGSDEAPPRHEIDGFTPGEMNVISHFCTEVFTGIRETWSGLLEINPEANSIVASTDVAEIIDAGAGVISTTFQISLRGSEHQFFIVWPVATLAPMLPVFEGAKKDRDVAEDERWGQVISTRVPDARVKISSEIGNAELTLRDVAALQEGDVVAIENPRRGTVFAKDVPVLEGRFGVHDGNYAIETTRWLADAAASIENQA